MLVPFYWTTQHQTPAHHNLDRHQHENFKFYTTWLLIKYHIVELSSKNSNENHWIEYNWCSNSTYKIIHCFQSIILHNNKHKKNDIPSWHIHHFCGICKLRSTSHSLALKQTQFTVVYKIMEELNSVLMDWGTFRVCWHFFIHSGIGDIKNNSSDEMRYEQRNDHISSQHSQTSISLTKTAAIWWIFLLAL